MNICTYMNTDIYVCGHIIFTKMQGKFEHTISEVGYFRWGRNGVGGGIPRTQTGFYQFSGFPVGCWLHRVFLSMLCLIFFKVAFGNCPAVIANA